ncbi:hypothetical protein PML80_06625 [Aerococcus urinaeequi]|uniref:Uncharacterized protein n=1 Tax=Aerococcus urinaeequi TaxID=51665 RepID=A0AAE9XH23_9LACT|nr:hypothetical protein [Aerococcus urinaeequi]WCG37197.1 hypothetical protein PML80_06625 [Aerococcus urinaeequi]
MKFKLFNTILFIGYFYNDETPTYIALKLGDNHGNYIDLAKYREDAKKNKCFNHALPSLNTSTQKKPNKLMLKIT